MKPTNSNQPFIPNKKLIIHFDVDDVLRINHPNKDLLVYQLCARWVWGRLQKTSKQDPEKVTGWKIASNNLSVEQPEPDMVSYNDYLDSFAKPSQQQREKLILNLSKGPCAKAKAEIQKKIKNITLPKTLFDSIKQTKQHQNLPLKRILQSYTQTGKYQILPAFFKFIMWLKKSKRQFALVIKNSNPQANHQQIIDELNLFFVGEHPLFNGKNGTPQVKFDGSKGCKNFVVDNDHQAVVYQYGDKEVFKSFGGIQQHQEKDVELFKQHFKSLKQQKLCEGVQNIYSHSHSILLQSACIYQINESRTIIIDPVDYLTHEIYFTCQNVENVKVYSCLGDRLTNVDSMVCHVQLFDFLKDVDYFVKQTEALEKKRAQEIEKNEKGDTMTGNQNQPEKIKGHQEGRNQNKQSDSEYLKRTILPVLEGALKEVTLLRPQDPIGYLALLCLKNKDRVKASK